MDSTPSIYGKWHPIIRQGHPNLKYGTKAYDDYWNEQRHFIMNGYEVGGERISGGLYWFLNYTKIDSNGEKVAPFYVGVDKEFFAELETCYKTGENLIVIKGRDSGFSFWMASECLRITQNFENKRVAMGFPGGRSAALENFRDKYVFSEVNLPSALRSTPTTANEEHRKYQIELTDTDTKADIIVGIKTEIFFKQAVNKDVFKSGRFKLLGVDEVGEISDPLGLYMASQANLMENGAKIGTYVMGGTSNTSNTGYKQAIEMFMKPQGLNMRSFWLPAQRKYFGEGKRFFNFETGINDEEAAKEFLEAKAKALEKSSMSAAIEERQNYPTELEHIMLATQSTLLNRNKIAKQKAYLLALENNPVFKYNLFEAPDGKVYSELDIKKGRWEILLMPRQKNAEEKSWVYDVAGVDSVYKELAPESESKCSIVIYRPYIHEGTEGELPICVYHHRYTSDDGLNKERWYNDLYLTLKFFGAKALVEDTDQSCIDWFMKRGIAHTYLLQKPQEAGIYSTTKANKYGVNPHGGAFDRSAKLLIEYVETKCQKIQFTTMLDDMGNFNVGRQNSDIGDAFKWALLADVSLNKILPQVKEKIEKNNSLPLLMNVGGSPRFISNSQREASLNFSNANALNFKT